ncbi:ANTAR domain-containing protein [Angustibacter aerolatus]
MAEDSLSRPSGTRRAAGALDPDRRGPRAAPPARTGLEALTSELAAAHEVIAQLQEALLHRDRIGQAKGVLMASRHLDADEAWQLLVGTSQHLNVKVRDLAELVALAGTLPDVPRRRPATHPRQAHRVDA